jgi:branched-chain amino acid transport system permease protein
VANKRNLIIAGILFLVFLLLPIGISSDYYINVMILIFLYIMIAQSWNLLGGYSGLINIGQSAFFGMGALITRLLWNMPNVNIPIYLCLIVGGLASVVLACAIGIPALRLRGIYFPIGTLGLGVMMKVIVFANFPGVSFLKAAELAKYSLDVRYYWMLILMACAIAALWLIMRSKLGLALMSIREDQDAAGAVGVNVLKYKIIALAISTFMAGVAGGAFAFYSVSYYYYEPFNSHWSLEPLLITFIGGVGTILGPIIGGVFFIVLKELFANFLGDVSVLVFGILFILVVLFLPGGLVSIVSRVRGLFQTKGLSKKAA